MELLSSSWKNKKKIPLNKFLYFLIFQEPKLSSFNIKKFIIFSETEILKKFFILQETELSYISGNRNPKKNSDISGRNFPSSKSKKNPVLKSFLYFRKCNFLAPSLEKILYFMGNFQSPKNQTLSYFPKNLWNKFSKNTFG